MQYSSTITPRSKQVERPGDDVIDNDVILVWAREKRVITGADIIGRLMSGIAKVETFSK